MGDDGEGRPADRPGDLSGASLLEVGLPRAPQQQNEVHTGQAVPLSLDNECERWKSLFEIQQRNLAELIRAIQEPRTHEPKITLPEFNPDAPDSDARAWCETIDLCLQEKPLSGGNLIITMSKALKGTAASWLAQSSFAGITWPQLKDLFLARFDFVETPAANLWRLLNGNPKEGECLSSYASRFMSTIMARWKSLSTEQIAIAVTLAHAAKIEPRLQRLAFTTEIDNRIKLQQELMAFTFRKRGPPVQEKTSPVVEAKKPRIENSRRCYNCGKLGHVSNECRGNSSRDVNTMANPNIRSGSSSTSLPQPSKEAIADQGRCFAGKDFRDYCNAHDVNLHLIATGSSRANGQVERVMSTLKNMLTAVETSRNKSWQDALPDIQLAINCTISRVTKASPLELLIGKIARPLDLMTLETDETDIDLNSIREQSAREIESSASYEKGRFDKSKAKVKKFKIGDYVLLENHERNQIKLDSKFKGPYLVVELLDGDRYLLKALNSNRTYKYAHDRVRAMPECYVPLELSVGLEVPVNQVEPECTDDGNDAEEDEANTSTHEDV